VAVEEQKELLSVLEEQERERENQMDDLEDEIKSLKEQLKKLGEIGKENSAKNVVK
jgi:hypothetical protein